jgi:hypothetical protein
MTTRQLPELRFLNSKKKLNPRLKRTNPRAKKTNPRALGTNPRALKLIQASCNQIQSTDARDI